MLGLSNYTVGNVASSISQIILYEDHGLELQYKDRSLLQLSPCGANFKYARPPRTGSDITPALGREVTQRCIFSTSETRSKVVQAILIRNQVCSPLYLPQDLLYGQECMKVFDLYEDIKRVHWPTHADERDESSNGDIHKTTDGAIVVTSNKGYAKLTLFQDRHRVLVTFLAKTSRCDSTRQAETSLKSKCKQTYVWQDIIFPAHMCPAEWHIPLALALAEDDTPPSSHNSDQSPLPGTLPLTCSKQFTHEWRSTLISDPDNSCMDDSDLSLPFLSDKCGRDCTIKMMWNDNATYWMTPTGAVEVWLSNAHILKSHPSAERSYTMLYPPASGTGAEPFQEKAVCASALPQHDTKLKSAVLRAMRLQMYSHSCHSFTSTLQAQPCWFEYVNSEQYADTNRTSSACKENHITSNSSSSSQITEDTLYEKVIVESVGVFSAIGDSIQIMFSDGALLHLTIDPNKLADQSVQFNTLSEGYCRLLYPNGQCMVLKSLVEPSSEGAPYTRHAIKWLEWLMQPAVLRRQKPFCSDTIHAPENANMVLHEIEKNKRFDRLLTLNPSLPGRLSPLPCATAGILASENRRPLQETISYRDVCDAMSNTSKAIDDIAAVIKSMS